MKTGRLVSDFISVNDWPNSSWKLHRPQPGPLCGYPSRPTMSTCDAPGHQAVKFSVEPPVSALGAHIQAAYRAAPLLSIWAWTASHAAIHGAGGQAEGPQLPVSPADQGYWPATLGSWP